MGPRLYIYGSGFGTYMGTISYYIMVDTQNIYFGGKIYVTRFTVRAYSAAGDGSVGIPFFFFSNNI